MDDAKQLIHNIKIGDECMFYKNDNIVERVVPPSYFLVDITKCYNNEYEKMFITDEVGFEMWKSISNGDSFEDILANFLEKISDEKNNELIECIKNDLKEYLDLLQSQGCIYEG